MKHRNRSNPANYASSYTTRMQNDPQVKKWAQRLLGDPTARPGDLSDAQLTFIYSHVLRQRGEEPNQTLFEQAMRDTAPIIAAPDWTDTAEDVGHVLAQPEMERFYRAWDPPQKPNNVDIDFAPAKAILTTLGMGGFTSHFDDALEHYLLNTGLQDVFANIERRPVSPPPYSSLMRHIHRAADSCWLHAIEANIAMVKSLAALFPGEGIGERLAIDGMPFSAWVPQKGSRDEALDKLIGRRIPQAGFRVYTQAAKNGKQYIKSNTPVSAGGAGTIHKAWRGFFVVAIVDLATGLPLVWLTISATDDEAACIVPLLSTLYHFWPDIPAKVIAGDSAWDEDEWCRLCEVDYGIAPVFRLHPTERERRADIPLAKDAKGKTASRDGRVWGFTGTGRLVCTNHTSPLDYYSFDRPARVDSNGRPLRPGQSSDERQFRLRATCDHNNRGHSPCGTVGLKAMVDWSRLTRLPHHKDGDAKKYAMRQALLVRLNHCESLWNRVKSGGLGVAGADRIRTLPMPTIEAAVSLRMLSFTALALADQRQLRQIGPYAPVQPAPIVVPNVVHRAAAPSPAAPAPAAPAPAAPAAPPVIPAAPARNPKRKPSPRTPKRLPAPAPTHTPAFAPGASATVRVVGGRHRVVQVGGRIIPPHRISGGLRA